MVPYGQASIATSNGARAALLSMSLVKIRIEAGARMARNGSGARRATDRTCGGGCVPDRRISAAVYLASIIDPL